MTTSAAATKPIAARIFSPSISQPPAVPFKIGSRGIIERASPSRHECQPTANAGAPRAARPSIDARIAQDRTVATRRSPAWPMRNAVRRPLFDIERVLRPDHFVTLQHKDRDDFVKVRIVGLIGGDLAPKFK